MKKSISFVCLLLGGLLLLTACQPSEQPQEQKTEEEALPAARTEQLHTLAGQLANQLRSGNSAAALAMMDEAMTKSMEKDIDQLWGQLEAQYGAFVETGSYRGFMAKEYEVLEMTLVFEKAKLVQRTVFGDQDRVAGLFFRPGEVAAGEQGQLPPGVSEQAVTVDAGYPLEGRLTLPQEGSPRAAVLLLAGSGPADMDETVGANKPLADLAHGLAQQGIATLRYEKRTHAHPADSQDFTVDQEYTEDALAAVELLRERQPGLPVFLLGHSQGGSLLAYLNQKGADVQGYVVLAGTPRKLWEVSARQNLELAQELESRGETEQAAKMRETVREEQIKAAELGSMSLEQARTMTVFGLPAVYQRSLEGVDPIALHSGDQKPVLILQGGRDRQVTTEDFALWQQGLQSHPAATFREYPELNHLMGCYTGEPVSLSELVGVEYQQRTPVDGEVIGDIATWILEHSQGKSE